MYEDDNTDGACPKSPSEEFEPTADAAPDQYLHTSVLLHRGGTFYQGKVIGPQA